VRGQAQGHADDLAVPLAGQVELPARQQPVHHRHRPARPAVQGLVGPQVHGGIGPPGQVGVDDLGGEAGFALAVNHPGPSGGQGGQVGPAGDADALALPGPADDQPGQPRDPAGQHQVRALAPVAGQVAGDRHGQRGHLGLGPGGGGPVGGLAGSQLPPAGRRGELGAIRSGPRPRDAASSPAGTARAAWGHRNNPGVDRCTTGAPTWPRRPRTPAKWCSSAGSGPPWTATTRRRRWRPGRGASAQAAKVRGDSRNAARNSGSPLEGPGVEGRGSSAGPLGQGPHLVHDRTCTQDQDLL
jgi:hypothetical protein